MKKRLSDQWERGRQAGIIDDGPFGNFTVRCPATNATLHVVVSDGRDWVLEGLPPPVWEHASVSVLNRCPTWGEMHWVKRQLWEDDELVVQFHPPEVRYVNLHPFVLHLWRTLEAIPLPPLKTV